MREALKPQEEPKKKEFDLRVQHRNPRTGLIEKVDPYTLHVIGDDHRKVYERPSGSGNCWDPRNNPIGRWDEKKGFIEGAKHIEFTPPETKDQILARSLIAKDTKIAALEKELAEYTAEKDRNSKPPKGQNSVT